MTTMSFLAFVSVRRIPAGETTTTSQDKAGREESRGKASCCWLCATCSAFWAFFGQPQPTTAAVAFQPHTHSYRTHTECVCLAVILPVRPQSLWSTPLPNFVHLFDNVWHCVKASLSCVCVCVCMCHMLVACGSLPAPDSADFRLSTSIHINIIIPGNKLHYPLLVTTKSFTIKSIQFTFAMLDMQTIYRIYYIYIVCNLL